MPRKKEKQTITSVRIDEKIWENFKIYCIKNKISMSKKLKELITKEIKNNGI